MLNYHSDDLGSLRAALLDHPLYSGVTSVPDLRRFMEDHVFAVWDFIAVEAAPTGHDVHPSAVVPC